MKKGILLLIAFLSLGSDYKIQSQENKVDSLLQLFEKAKQDTTRIQLLLNIGDIYEHNIPDTALYYYNKAIGYAAQAETSFPTDKTTLNKYQKKILTLKAKSLRYIGIVMQSQGGYDSAMLNYAKSLKINEELGYAKGMASSFNNIGNIHLFHGNYNKAIEYYLKALTISKKLSSKEGMAMCYGNIGNVYIYQGNYDNAVDYLLKSLSIKEELGNKKGMANTYSNIGALHSIQGNYDKAFEYYQKSLKIDQELDDKNGMASSYLNIGSVSNEMGNYNSSMEYYFKALKISKKLGHKKVIATCYNNIGIIQNYWGNYNKAIEYYLKSLKINEELNDKESISTNYSRIAFTYMALADTCESIGSAEWKSHLQSTLEYANKSYDLSVDIGALPRQNDAATNLQKAYAKLGYYKEAVKYAKICISTQDSMFSKEKTKSLAEMTTKYEAEKKQLQIEKMEKQKELDDKTIEVQQAENRKQQIIIFSVVGGFLIVLVFSIIILRLFRQKRKANILLAEQNEEINQQKDQIEEQSQNITDSIVYAQRIQHALLPPGDYMKELLPNRFILYKPRDIVSGDFYWVNKKDGLIISAAADSTGHGVPGAMLSMLGVSILNEIVGTMQKPDAGEILNLFRSKLIDSYYQSGQEKEMWDGFDIALCLIDLKKQEVQFAGANNPLYLIRDGELQVIKADKMPIGAHFRMDPFTNHIIKVQSDDILYLFSDGYIDQFGGENDKRFTQKRFKELLLSINNKSIIEQKEKLDKTLTKWQGKSDQIDDVLVMGIRI